MNYVLLGAQKHYHHPDKKPGIRFSVYAPNARSVEVVFGLLWNVNDSDRKPINRNNPAPLEEIAGGYVADDGNGIDPNMPVILLRREGNGVWFSDPDDPELSDFSRWDHATYMFRIVKNDRSTAYCTDLYSRCQIGYGNFNPHGKQYEGLISALKGSKSCSVIVDPDTVTAHFDETVKYRGKNVSMFPETRFVPQEEFWKDEFVSEYPMPKRLEDLVIYQLHIPALGFDKTPIGTVAEAIELLDHLDELGVNAVELLPVSGYGGDTETWGYSTSHHFAIEFSGGGRDKMKYFIREAHRRGIAVIFDVVYNHFAHDAERAEWLYDTNDHEKNIYFWYHGHPFDYPNLSDGTGGYVDNLSSAFAPRYWDPLVRNLFISSAIALVREFHVDGFRVDQTSSIHAYNVLHADGSARGDANVAGGSFLREWTDALHTVNPSVFLTAEDHSNWDAVTRPTSDGGLGFDAVWYADYHHQLVGADQDAHCARLLAMAGQGGNEPLAMDRFADVLAGSGRRKIVYHLNHDEAGNAGRDKDFDRRTHRTMIVAVHDHLDKTNRSYAEARSRLVFGITLFSAGTPLFLFGEEVAFLNDFFYDDVLAKREDLFGNKNGPGKNMFTFYRDAIRLRQSNAALRSRNIEILHVHNDNRVVAFRRWCDEEEMLIVASLNNTPFDKGYLLRHPSITNGNWREILTSDSVQYGGNGTATLTSLQSFDTSIDMRIPQNTILAFGR